MYVSFNDGANWQPLQLNLPMTSVRDMVIHGDDLVVATHGRGFYILDDIAPLRQAATAVLAPIPFLYEPQIATRVDNDAFPGTPLPPEEPTAENPPAGSILDYYLPSEVKSLTVSIYTAGSHQDRKLVRHFSSATPAKADHMDLPIADRWFPIPQRLATTPGHHRLLWNLAWGTSGVAESDEPDDGEGGVPRGPKVEPGTYAVEFFADGTSMPLERQLTVVMDPRAAATAAELQQNFATTYKIFSNSLEARRALAEMESVQTQFAKLVSAKTKLTTQTRTLAFAIESILSGSEKTMGLNQANTELTAALNVAESSDRAIPSQALEVYAEASTASSARVKEWAALKQGPLAKFNEQLKSQNQRPIAISVIEHEVQVLMTQ